jgi:hypothetical protein
MIQQTIVQYTNLRIGITSYNIGDGGSAGSYWAEVATKDKIILYLKPLVLSDWTYKIVIGNETMQVFCNNLEGVAVDLRSIVQTIAENTSETNMEIAYYDGSTLIGRTYIVLYILKGYHYADFARQLMKVPKIGNYNNVNYNPQSGSFLLRPVPLNYYAPFMDNGGANPFNVRQLRFPFWSTFYGNQNVTAYVQGTQITSGTANMSKIVTYETYGLTEWRAIGGLFFSVLPRKMKCTEKYIIVHFTCPYAPYRTSGGVSEIDAQFIFRLYAIETDVQIQNQIGDATNLYPYKISKQTILTCGIDNITAWDYAIYSQILLSEKIEVLIDQGTTFEPVRLDKQNFQSNTSLSDNLDFKFKLIIEEND